MISSAYNYYLTNYVGKEVSKYDTHKKSELRDVYNHMVKINKNAPLYKIADSEDVKKYAIDLKEAARAITNIASELSENEDTDSGFSKKKAISSDESVVSVKYVGTERPEQEPEELKIKVEGLATNQINRGNFLNQSELGLKSGAYSFDFAIGEYTYEFQFNVKIGENNRDIQDKLARLINRANIGVKAEIVENSLGFSALSVESEATGLANYDGTIFKISSNESSEVGDAVAFFGLDDIYKMPQNAKFTVNGIEKSSSSNTFTIAKQYLVNLNSVSDEEISIGLKPDFDTVIDNVNEFIDKYNSMVELAKKRIGNGYEAEKLYRDIGTITSYHKKDLDSAGFKVEDDGKINVDEEVLIQSVSEGTLKDSLGKLGTFKKTLLSKANSISLNPMAYVDKKLIAYKRPGNNFNNAYMTSIYSGMMFNGYV